MTKKFFIPVDCYSELRDLAYKHHGVDPILLSKYVYIIHLLYTRTTLFRDDFDEKGIKINAEEIYKLIGRSYKRPIFSNLQQWGFIVPVLKYIPSSRSQSYRLHERVLTDKFSTLSYDVEDFPWLKKIIIKNNSFDAKSHVAKHQLFILQNAIKLSDEGLDYIQQKYPSPAMQKIIENYKAGNSKMDFSELQEKAAFHQSDMMLTFFLAKDYFVSRPDPESRIFNNLTSLKREYRQFILLQNKPILMTDIRNSQILFSVPIIENRLKITAGKRGPLPTNFYNYKEWAEDGSFYNKLANEIGLDLTDEVIRKEFKQQFFRDIFFSKVSTKGSTLKKAFIRLFPNVYKAINLVKANDHADFAINLQKKEAQLICSVLRKLYKKDIPALTIHDCIVVNSEEQLTSAEELLKEECKKQYGLNVTFKREDKHMELPPLQPEEHENVKWFNQFGLETNGNYCWVGDVSVNVKTLGVRFSNTTRVYPYSKAGVANLIYQKQAELIERIQPSAVSSYTLGMINIFSSASLSGSVTF